MARGFRGVVFWQHYRVGPTFKRQRISKALTSSAREALEFFLRKMSLVAYRDAS